MIPQVDVSQVDRKLSNDIAAHVFDWMFIISIAIYFGLVHGWHGRPALQMGFILGLVALQSITRFLPVTRNWKAFNSGGIGALAIYNVALGLLFLWFLPLYSPFMLILPVVMFITIYYRGNAGYVASLLVQAIVIIAVSLKGSHPPGYHSYYPWLTIFLAAAYGGVIQRISTIDNNVRSEFKKAATRIEVEREQLRSLINSMADAVMATDLEGKIQIYNGASLILLNTNASLENKPFDNFLTLYDTDGKHVDVLADARSQGRAIKREDLHFISNENEPTDIYINIAPIRSNFGAQDQGFIILLRDITKEKSLEEERDEFISVTSHELRTPVAIAEANISTALLPNVSKGMEPNVRQLLDQAHSNIIFLGDLINDMTTLARAERGDLEVTAEPLVPGDLLKQLAHDYEKEAQAKGLSISVNVAPDAPRIQTSKLYVHEILQNFLTNAIKYTPKGAVELSAKPGDKERVVFAVKDSGIGIGKSDRAKVFSKFYRSEDYRTRQTRGTGLGLYITLKLAERLQGKIWFDSELNKGSTFYLEIPSLKIHAHPSNSHTPAALKSAAAPEPTPNE